jgi:hypothetical protein
MCYCISYSVVANIFLDATGGHANKRRQISTRFISVVQLITSFTQQNVQHYALLVSLVVVFCAGAVAVSSSGSSSA